MKSPPPLVAGQPPREWPSNAGGHAGTRGGRAYVIKGTLYSSTTVARGQALMFGATRDAR